MRKIKRVLIDGFWGDKTVILNFNHEVNFLIGVNGSGKTTIINLIAASLNADFSTLDKIQFSAIRVEFFNIKDGKKTTDETYIEIEKIEKQGSPYPNIVFKIKLPNERNPKSFRLDELEEEILYRYPVEYQNLLRNQRYHSRKTNKDINVALRDIVSLTWLSIHRISRNRTQDEKSFESSIDQKINELSTDLVKYFGVLDKQYSTETEKFQKNIFLSLIEEREEANLLRTGDLDSEKEKESLKQIFFLFKLKESEFSEKLENYFKTFDEAKKLLIEHAALELRYVSYILGTRRIHSIVQEWVQLNEKKNIINKPKLTFINEINSLFQRKEIFINEKNELLVKTQSGKIFPLVNLSSGEKQLMIILGESLLKENVSHIYIADEPELSLHVEWQEKLVRSLKNVNSNSQIIFATHSPDIVGQFSDAVIKVEDAIK